MGDHQLMAMTDGHDPIKILLGSHLCRGVMGVAEHEQFELIPKRRRDGGHIWAPILISGERQGTESGTRQMQATAVGWVAGIQMQCGIPWVQHGKRQMGRAFLRSNQQLNFTIRIHRNVEALPAPICDGLMKRSCRGLEAIGGTSRLGDRGRHGLQHWGWWLEIRRTDRQVD